MDRVGFLIVVSRDMLILNGYAHSCSLIDVACHLGVASLDYEIHLMSIVQRDHVQGSRRLLNIPYQQISPVMHSRTPTGFYARVERQR